MENNTKEYYYNDLEEVNSSLSESIIFTYYEATITLDGLAYIGGVSGYTPIAGWTNCGITEWINVAILGSKSNMSYCVKLTDRHGNDISGDVNFGVAWVKFNGFS